MNFHRSTLACLAAALWCSFTFGHIDRCLAGPAPLNIPRITTNDRDGTSSLGSGVLVTIDGAELVLTNRHVVQDAVRVWVEWPGIGATEAKVIAIGRRGDDWAALQSQVPRDAQPYSIAYRFPQPGERLVFAGHGGHRGYQAVAGRMLKWEQRDDGGHTFAAGVSVRSGDSGGPVISESGEVLGLLWGTARGETSSVPAPMIVSELRGFGCLPCQRGGGAMAVRPSSPPSLPQSSVPQQPDRPLVPVTPRPARTYESPASPNPSTPSQANCPCPERSNCPECDVDQLVRVAVDRKIRELIASGKLRGERGPQGPPGEPGDRGPAGPTGATGYYKPNIDIDAIAREVEQRIGPIPASFSIEPVSK